MRRPSAWLRMVVLGGIAAQAGCGTEPPVGLPDRLANPGGMPAGVVFLVLPSSPDSQLEYLTWVQAGQDEAGGQRIIFRASGPPTGAPPTEQPEAVRMAIAGGATMLVVVLHDPGAIAPALAEAEAKGIAVVTLGGSKAADPPLPGTAVVPEPFADSAAKLVKAVVDDAAKRNLPADPPAVLLFDKKGDWFSAERAEALKAAARAAGLTHLEPLGYEVEGLAEGRTEALRVLIDWINAHPETAIVLAEGDEAMAAANRYRGTVKSERPILVAGYIGFRGQVNPNTLRGNSAFVEGKLDGLARLAVRTALAKSRGEKPGPIVVMPTPFSRKIGDATRDDGLSGGASTPSVPGLPGPPRP